MKFHVMQSRQPCGRSSYPFAAGLSGDSSSTLEVALCGARLERNLAEQRAAALESALRGACLERDLLEQRAAVLRADLERSQVI